MEEAVIIVADTHINSKLGLCNPNVYLDDGDEYEFNLVQKWLWDNWQKFISDIKKITKKYKKTIILNGDIVDLDAKNRSGQMISTNPADILRMAKDTLDPLLSIADRFFMVRGTEAHTGLSAWAEEVLAREYGAVREEETNRYAWWHLRAKFSGVKFDVAHHASMGSLPWTYASAASRLVQLAKMEYYEWGETPPDVVVRSHQHRFAESGVTFSTRGVYTPCWQYANAYLYRLGKENNRPSIGGIVFICNNGKHDMIPFLYEPKRSKIWEEK